MGDLVKEYPFLEPSKALSNIYYFSGGEVCGYTVSPSTKERLYQGFSSSGGRKETETQAERGREAGADSIQLF